LYPLFRRSLFASVFFPYRPHRTFHQLIISLPEARACFSLLFSSQANFSFSHSFFLCLLSYASPSLPLFRLTLFCPSNRPGCVCFILPDICLFFIFFFRLPLSRFTCPLLSLYAGRSSKRRIIVHHGRSLCFAMNNAVFRPPSF